MENLEIYLDYIGDDSYVYRYNYDSKKYYNTGICLKGSPGNPGRPGRDGKTPHIGTNGNWFIGDIDTGVKASGGGSSGSQVQSDWNQTDNTTDDFIKNKPTIPSALSQLSEDTTHRVVSDAEKTTWNNKQDVINDLASIRSGAAAGATAYQKPQGGIPKTDLAQGVKDSLDLADTALQEDALYYDANGHDYVEIGGIKWATKNIGANAVTDAGLYFQWGDTQGYTAEQVGVDKDFTWADYKFSSDAQGSSMTKYNSTDGKTVLELEDDAARANWGGSWRMPTTEEMQAFGAAVNAVWTDDYQGSGVAGLICTDKTDNTKVVFFPAAGCCGGGSVGGVGSGGYCWYSSLHTDSRQLAYSLYFDSSDAGWDDVNERYYGFAVRPILDTTQLKKELDKKANDADLATVAKSGSYNDLTDKPTIPTVPTNVSAFTNDVGYLTQHQDISGKENVTTIVAPVNTTDATLPITSLTCEVGKYYRLDVAVDTLAVTLPVMENITTAKTVVLYLTGGTTPAVTISSTAPTGGSAPDVYYQDGYVIESGKTYEVNCLWNGAAWIVASVEIILT